MHPRRGAWLIIIYLPNKNPLLLSPLSVLNQHHPTTMFLFSLFLMRHAKMIQMGKISFLTKSRVILRYRIFVLLTQKVRIF